jgi:PST family polysaccharide transporter/lipopolysaccharide exporter
LIVYSIASVVFAWLGLGAMSLVWATLSGTIVTGMMSVFVAYRSGWLPLLHFRWHDLSEYLKFGLFQSGGRVLKYLSNNVDYLIIGSLLGSTALGYYTLAYNLMRLPLGYINPLINTVAFPVFSRVQNDIDLLRQGYTRLLRYLSIASVPIAAGMFSVVHLLIPALYGSQWIPAIPIVQIFAGLGILFSLNDPLESILLAKGRPDLLLYMSGCTVFGYSIASFIGSYWGIEGVAVGSLLATLMVAFPIQITWIRRFAGLDFFQMWSATKVAFISSFFMMLAVSGLSNILNPYVNGLLLLLLLVITGCISFGLCVFILDRRLMGSILKDFGLAQHIIRFQSRI